MAVGDAINRVPYVFMIKSYLFTIESLHAGNTINRVSY